MKSSLFLKQAPAAGTFQLKLQDSLTLLVSTYKSQTILEHFKNNFNPNFVETRFQTCERCYVISLFNEIVKRQPAGL